VRPAAVPSAPQGDVSVYIGRIPPDCPNVFVMGLLSACGKVVRWRRMEDGDSGKPKPFGYCDYDSLDSARRVGHALSTPLPVLPVLPVLMSTPLVPPPSCQALRLLNNLKVDGNLLLARVDSKTQALIDQVDAAKRDAVTNKADGGLEMGELPAEASGTCVEHARCR
jgi:hypothetical protein